MTALKSPKLAAIVPTHSDFPYSLRCLQSLARHTSDYRTLVLDDGSPEWSPALADRIRRLVPGVHIEHFTENDGLTRSWNAGLRWARSIGAEYTALINSDTLLPGNWFGGIEAVLGRLDLVGPVSNAPGDPAAYALQHVTTHLPDYEPSDDPAAIARTSERLRERKGRAAALRVNGPGMKLRNRLRGTRLARRVNGFFLVSRTATWWRNAWDDDHVFDPSRKLLGAEDEFQQRFSGRIGIALSTFIFHYRSASRGLENVKPAYSQGAFRPSRPLDLPRDPGAMR